MTDPELELPPSGFANETFVLDVTLSEPAWCPYDEDTGTVTIGLSILSEKCPGDAIGVYHEDGPDAVEAWLVANPDWVEKWWKK